MRRLVRASAGAIAAALSTLVGGFLVAAQDPSSPEPAQEEEAVAARARATFEVELTPQQMAGGAEGLGRMSIEKRFHGDLEATSRGEMLTALTGVDGSAGYVAIERVTGTLHGREGSFTLQHSGTMTRGEPHLTIAVVPDSGTGGLTGLAGRMTIVIEDGKHSCDFEYTLPGRR